MNTKIAEEENVPDTNSPARVGEAKHIGPSYSEGSTLRERESKIIYKHADMIHTGERWDQTTNTAGITGSSARTTFRAKEADSSSNLNYDRMWVYQMGRGQTYEDSRRKDAVRKDATWKRCDAILQSCDIPKWVRDITLGKVLKRDLYGFSRHYNGADGACVGFALLELCDDPEEAEDCWVVNRAVEVLHDFDQQKVESLISYVFRKYGGDTR
ncbi:hypothetical protein [Halorubrum sp. 48-1-W]|uniref:hypothetical protein n=1 Tax=Halorubrum sp. 48-1-W TaxID=2249761 RepID=UPI000FCC7861|nr:hypothetical protein [Halorubrum sp. 48-1-W]